MCDKGDECAIVTQAEAYGADSRGKRAPNEAEQLELGGRDKWTLSPVKRQWMRAMPRLAYAGVMLATSSGKNVADRFRGHAMAMIGLVHQRRMVLAAVSYYRRRRCKLYIRWTTNTSPMPTIQHEQLALSCWFLGLCCH